MQTVLTIARSILWAALGTFVGILAWSTLAATVMPLLYPTAHWWREYTGWPWAFVGSAYFAAFIGAVAAPVYVVAFAGWLAARRRWPTITWLADPRAAALLLGTPMAAAVAWNSGHTEGWPFRWDECARMLAIGLPSCWLAVVLPPSVLRGLRRELRGAAG